MLFYLTRLAPLMLWTRLAYKTCHCPHEARIRCKTDSRCLSLDTKGVSEGGWFVLDHHEDVKSEGSVCQIEGVQARRQVSVTAGTCGAEISC